jgi:predicted nucleotidyltransferase
MIFLRVKAKSLLCCGSDGEREKIMKRNEIIRTLRGFMDMNKDRYEIIRIGVFGSAARDSMNEQSDVDVVVELGKPDLFYLVGIKQDLEEKFHRPGEKLAGRP